MANHGAQPAREYLGSGHVHCIGAAGLQGFSVKEKTHMAAALTLHSDTQTNGIHRGAFLRQAGVAAAGVALGGGLLPGLSRVQLTSASGTTLNVSYFSNNINNDGLVAVFNQFGKKNGLPIGFTPEPVNFGDVVSKFTTYLSSGYSGIDVYWIDEEMASTFSAAGWLEPLETHISKDNLSSIGSGPMQLSTFNGHVTRVPGMAGGILFYYRKDLFDKAGLQPPKTWSELVKIGKQFTKGGMYGLGFAGKTGNTQLWIEGCYWMGQAGADPYHLRTPQARMSLKFLWDMLNTYKILPANTVTADYSLLQTEFLEGRLAMWPVWANFYATFISDPGFKKKGFEVSVAFPPKGPRNGTTLSDSWGWSVSKFAKNKDLAFKFIEFITSKDAEIAISQAELTLPANLQALATPQVQRAVSNASFVAAYNQRHLFRPRPITPQVQRLSDAFEAPINQYLNKQISLAAAINQAQTKIDQINQNS